MDIYRGHPSLLLTAIQSWLTQGELFTLRNLGVLGVREQPVMKVTIPEKTRPSPEACDSPDCKRHQDIANARAREKGLAGQPGMIAARARIASRCEQRAFWAKFAALLVFRESVVDSMPQNL